MTNQEELKQSHSSTTSNQKKQVKHKVQSARTAQSHKRQASTSNIDKNKLKEQLANQTLSKQRKNIPLNPEVKTRELSPETSISSISKMRSLNSSPSKFSVSFSTLGNLKGLTTFNRSKRDIGERTTYSPGACHYNVQESLDYLRRSSPSARISQAPKQDIWQIKDTPGPNAYEPNYKVIFK